MKEHVDIDGMTGKTIAGVIEDCDDRLIIAYTDGSYTRIRGAYEHSPEVDETPISIRNLYPRDLEELMAVGVITAEDIEHDKQLQAAAEEEYRLQRERQERRTYEQLKAKFGETNAPTDG